MPMATTTTQHLTLIPDFQSSSEVQESSTQNTSRKIQRQQNTNLQTGSSFWRWARCCCPRRRPPLPAAAGSGWSRAAAAPAAAGHRSQWSSPLVWTGLEEGEGHQRSSITYQDVASSPDLCCFQGWQVSSIASVDMNTNTTPVWLLLFS